MYKINDWFGYAMMSISLLAVTAFVLLLIEDVTLVVSLFTEQPLAIVTALVLMMLASAASDARSGDDMH